MRSLRRHCERKRRNIFWWNMRGKTIAMGQNATASSASRQLMQNISTVAPTIVKMLDMASLKICFINSLTCIVSCCMRAISSPGLRRFMKAIESCCTRSKTRARRSLLMREPRRAHIIFFTTVAITLTAPRATVMSTKAITSPGEPDCGRSTLSIKPCCTSWV